MMTNILVPLLQSVISLYYKELQSNPHYNLQVIIEISSKRYYLLRAVHQNIYELAIVCTHKRILKQ